jgi:hypothetical protein
MAVREPQKPLAGDELSPYERDGELEDDRCPDCGQATISTPNHEWCIRCAQDVASTHPTGKPPEKRLRIETRFWEKVEIRQQDQCWEWQAAINQAKGYGRFRAGDRVYPAHRVAAALYRGLTNPDNLPGDVVRHRCDNPPCCNPRHLIPGNSSENMIDALVRGGLDPQFTEREIRRVRELEGEMLQSEIAERYGASQQMISKIQRGERYAWVK